MDRPEYEFRFMGSGGEPTLHPHLYEMLKITEEKFEGKLSKDGLWVITNGNKSLEYFQSIKTPNITYHFSIHPETVDIEHLKELIINLSKHSNVHAKLMWFPKQREKCREISNLLTELQKDYEFIGRIAYVFCSPYYNQPLKTYTDEDFNFIDHINRKLNKSLYRSWKIHDKSTGKYCIEMLNLMKINESGQYNTLTCVNSNYEEETLHKKKIKDNLNSYIQIHKCHNCFCNSGVDMYWPPKKLFETEQEAEEYCKEARKVLNVN